MDVIDIEDFKNDCNNGKCDRYGNNNLYNKKTCLTESKQNKCYEKYIISLEKKQQKQIDKIISDKEKFETAIENDFENQIDYKWEEIKREVWNRDTIHPFQGTYKIKNWTKYCAVWNKILDRDEKIYILKKFREDLVYCTMLSNMHIESRQRKPELKYDTNNIILAGNYFHSLFDNYFDIVTREVIKEDRRNYWINRFKEYIIGEKQDG